MNSTGGPEQLEPAEIQQLHSQSTVTVTESKVPIGALEIVTMMSEK